MAQQVQNIQQLFQLIAQHFGVEIGKQVRAEIEKIVNVSNVNIDDINKKIEVIQKLLDADPNTPEFDVAQNIIAQIKTLIERVAKTEGAVLELRKALADVQNAQAELEKKVEEQTKQLEEKKADRNYVDSNFINVKEIMGLNIDAIVADFSKCLQAGLRGETCETEAQQPQNQPQVPQTHQEEQTKQNTQDRQSETHQNTQDRQNQTHQNQTNADSDGAVL